MLHHQLPLHSMQRHYCVFSQNEVKLIHPAGPSNMLYFWNAVQSVLRALCSNDAHKGGGISPLGGSRKEVGAYIQPACCQHP